ncbi:MAG: cysteine synthase family protein [Chloroflexi bacterium]|nr:cysteine synthase family protein [Chloroflexota bacterium]
MTVVGSLLDQVGHTPLVEISVLSPRPEVRIFAKIEGANPTGSVKDRIAKFMIEAAERDGRLEPGQTILEPTSGNTGIALALIGRLRGYPVKVVLPDAVSRERVELLHAYGAEIISSPGDLGTNGSVRMAERVAAEHPDWFMPYQYENEDNPRAHYETTAPEIIEDLPDVDVFVAGLGTGGTLTGVGRRLKEHNPAVRIVAAAPHPGDLVQGLRSLEEGYIPPVFDESVLDGRIVVDSASSFRATRELTERTGIFAGVSSGAVVRAAQKVAEQMERGKIVCLLADNGWKYLSSGLWTRDYADIEEDVATVLWW